jgi:hypothetical protein
MLASLRHKGRVRAEFDPMQLPTFVVSSDEEAAAAIDHIITYFGEDPARTAVRLVLEHQEVRYLEPEDMDSYLLAEDDYKGYGESAHATVPGLSTPGSSQEYQFRCPVADCPDSPLFVLTFTEPPKCRIHGKTLEPAP